METSEGAADVLRVGFAGRAVGELRHDGDGHLSFRYTDEWLDGGFAISLSMPLRDRVYDDVAQRFFVNLLPEGQVRALVARRLGVSEDNDWELLVALGGDCAGALTLTETIDEPAPPVYRELTIDELRSLAATPHPGLAAISGEQDLRLSLAGAQDKLPVRATAEGEYRLPLGAAPSTHIIKFAGTDFAHLTANEVFVTDLARRLDLPVSPTTLDTRFDPPLCVVERYDRVLLADDSVRRVHQEDLCQALGLPYTRKYEAEGGPDLAAVVALLDTHAADPIGDRRALIRWLAFCLLVGNADGHGKNLSLLYDGAAPRLAPFYDLLSTAVYPGISQRLALSVAGQADPGDVKRADWLRLGRQLDVRPAYVLDLVDEMTTALAVVLERSEAEFRDAYGESPILQMVPPLVRRRGRRARSMLREAKG